MAGQELANSVVERFVSREISKGKKLRQHTAVELCGHIGVSKDHLDLRPEEKALPRELIIERFDPQAVAGDEQYLLVLVPDGESEHAAQVLNTVATVLFVEMNDGLGITMSSVGMAAGDELLAQAKVVVNLTVEDNPDRAVLVADGLMAGCEVHDAQPAHADADMSIKIEALVIRTPVGHDAAHFPKRVRVSPSVPPKLQNASDATHPLFAALS